MCVSERVKENRQGEKGVQCIYVHECLKVCALDMTLSQESV